MIRLALCLGFGRWWAPLGVGRATRRPLRIALLHLAPQPGEVDANRRTIERAVALAAHHGADWIVTPELATSGYTFAARIGTGWIGPQPDAWLQTLGVRAGRLGVTALFVAQPERDTHTGRLHNTAFVVNGDGCLLGRHRKIRTLRHGSEAWSSPGHTPVPVDVPLVGKVGVLICADAYPSWIATRLADAGARLLISPANWGPGQHGPSGEWARCSRDTGLPMLVCNRTGLDGAMDFRRAASAVAAGGRRLISLRSPSPVIFLVDWDGAGPPRYAPPAIPIPAAS